MKTPKGQILPIASILLSLFILALNGYGSRWIRSIEKVQQQSEVDALVLSILNQPTRALNAIAALNQGLEIVKERGHAIAIALITLKACAALTVGTSPCLIAYLGLRKDAGPFFRKLQKLANELAKQQNQIKAWAEETSSHHIRMFNGKHQGEKILTLRSWTKNPTEFPLLIQRATPSTFDFISLPIQVPPPYVLQKSFFHGGNQLQLALKTRLQATPFQDRLRISTFSKNTPPTFLSISSGKIEGSNLGKMHFFPTLSKFNRPKSTEGSL